MSLVFSEATLYIRGFEEAGGRAAAVAGASRPTTVDSRDAASVQVPAAKCLCAACDLGEVT